MQNVSVLLIDAFTATPGKGNRAGVVLDASALSSEEMQAVAALINVSETAFIIFTPDEAYDVQVRYFTPRVEVPSCGHATIAAHFARSTALNLQQGRVVAKIGAGILPVDIETAAEGKKVVMTQGDIVFSEPYSLDIVQEICEALGLLSSELIADLPVQEVSTGHSKVIVPITSVARLDALLPDMERLSEISEQIGCNGFFVFAFTADDDSCLTSGRMFGPRMGIAEDPVTGNGNGPCGAYLAKHGMLPDGETFSYWGRQGVAMGKEGVIEVTVHRSEGEPTAIQVGGYAVEAGSREVCVCQANTGQVIASYVEGKL